MAITEGFYNGTEGSGKKFHLSMRTIGGDTMGDEFVVPGEFPYASYFLQYSAVSVATANDHAATVNAGASLPVRIRRIYASQVAVAGAANSLALDIIRTTTGAPSGGTAVVARPHNSADGAAGCSGIAIPGVKGTVGVTLARRRLPMAAVMPTGPALILWEQLPNTEPIIIPAGVVNGIALNVVAAVAGASIDVTIEVVETNFV
jgi:hypothetical protein